MKKILLDHWAMIIMAFMLISFFVFASKQENPRVNEGKRIEVYKDSIYEIQTIIWEVRAIPDSIKEKGY